MKINLSYNKEQIRNLENRWNQALRKILQVMIKAPHYLDVPAPQIPFLLEKITISKMRNKGSKLNFFVISGASGVGKGEITKELSKKIIRLPHITSRNPRPGEVNGRDYFFLKSDKNQTAEEKFKQMIKQDRFLIYRKTYGDYRGISKELFLKYVKEKKIFFLERSVPAFLEFIKLSTVKKTKFYSIYILPLTFKNLLSRLLKRNQKDKSLTKKEIKERLEEAVRHLEIITKKFKAKKFLYDLFIVNLQAKNQKEVKLMAKKIANKIYRVLK